MRILVNKRKGFLRCAIKKSMFGEAGKDIQNAYSLHKYFPLLVCVLKSRSNRFSSSLLHEPVI